MITFSSQRRLDPRQLGVILEGANGRAEGCHRVLQFLRKGLDEKKFSVESLSYRDVAVALGVIDPYDYEGAVGSLHRHAIDTESFSSQSQMEREIFQEANAAVTTHTFQIITSELIGRMIIDGYNSEEGYIGDMLVTTIAGQRMRNQRIPGVTHLAGPNEVQEGHPYEEMGFEDKFVTTKESKKGRILSLTAEMLLFDQTGLINDNARQLGSLIRQERERTIVRGVIDADASTNPVYRPSGTGEALYNTDGSNYNYIGSGNTTSSSFNAAVALADWTDVDTALKYRATEITDDRVDGSGQPIASINSGSNILLVPESLRSTAEIISGQVSGEKLTDSGNLRSTFAGNPVSSRVSQALSSPFIDEVNTSDWYYGNFKKQFVWTEIWPVTVSSQGSASEAAFERDVVLRVKGRYYGGISARDTLYVTKIDGA